MLCSAAYGFLSHPRSALFCADILQPSMHSAVICISKTPCSNAGMQTLPHANFAWRSPFRAGLLTQASCAGCAFPKSLQWHMQPTRPLQRRVRAGISPVFPLSRPPSGGTWNLFILFLDIITPSLVCQSLPCVLGVGNFYQ